MSNVKMVKKDTPTNDEYLNLYELGVLDELPPEAFDSTVDGQTETAQ